MHLRRQNLIGDFKVKIDQPITEKRIDSEMKTISAITRDPLDRKSPEARCRLSQSERYRMSRIQGTFTVESGGVFVPQLFKTQYFKGLRSSSLYNIKTFG